MTRPRFYFPNEEREPLTTHELPIYKKPKGAPLLSVSTGKPILLYGDEDERKSFAEVADAWLDSAIATLSPTSLAAHTYSFSVLYEMLSLLSKDLPIKIHPFAKNTRALPVEVISHGLFYAIAILLRHLTKEGLSLSLRAEAAESEGRIVISLHSLGGESFMPDREILTYLQHLASRFCFSLLPVFSENENGFCFCLPKKQPDVFRFFAFDQEDIFFFFRLPFRFF